MNAHRLPQTLCRQNESANSQKPRKSAEQMGEIHKPNKSAEQIGEHVGRIWPPMWGGYLHLLTKGRWICCDSQNPVC